ncbi:MAG: glycosyltransferase [Planctomycetota bacterium]
MSTADLPCVTFGLPVYNGATFLEESLRSLLSQDYPEIRVVVSDNCSTDETAEICAAFAAEDERVSIHRTDRNVGAAANFNRVVELASTPYFAWANHDDLWDPSYVSKCVAVLEADPEVALAYARSAKIDARGDVVDSLLGELGLEGATPVERLRRFHDLFIEVDRRGGWHEHAIEGLWIPVYGVMRRAALARTQLIGPYIASDTILLEELLLHGRFHEVPEQLFFKRDHEERSMRASLSYDKRIDWFTGQKSGLLIFPRWRLFAERLRAVSRAPLERRDRSACRSEMVRFYGRRSHEGKALVKEVGVNALRLTRPVFRAFGRSSSPAPEKW